jgi:autotransporter-associated beta strand protein
MLETTALVVATLALAAISDEARAQSVWAGAGSSTTTSDYKLNTNWGPATAPIAAGQPAVFAATGSSAVTVTAGPIAPNAWTFNSNSRSYTITGAAVNFSQAGASGGIINNASAGQQISIANNIGESVAGVQLQQLGAGSLFLSGTNTYTGATTVSGGTLSISGSGSITSNVTNSASFSNGGTVTGSLTNTGRVTATGSIATSATFNGAIVNADAATFTTNQNVVANGSFSNSGTARLVVGLESHLSGITTLTNSSTNASGIFIGNLSSLSADHVINAAGSTIDNNGRLISLLGPISNAGTLNTDGRDYPGASSLMSGGIVNTGTVSAMSSISGVIVNSGAGRFFATSLSGDSTFLNQDMAQLIVSIYRSRGVGFNGLTSLTNTSAAAVGVEVLGDATLSVNGPVTNSGNIRVDAVGVMVAGNVDNQAGGSIIVNGRVNSSLANAGLIENNGLWSGTVANAGDFHNNIGASVSGLLTNIAGTTVNNGALNGGANVGGGMFTGTGTVTNLAVSGGTFAPGDGTPGTSMRVTGSLAFQSGALYLVQLNPATSSFANVTGSAALNGAVRAAFAPGSYVARQYTILTAAGGVSGAFNSVVNSNLPAGFQTSLSYDGTHAYLNLAIFTGPSFGNGLPGNQQNVANALTNFFNTTGGIPMVFGTLTPAGLTQVSGETAVGSQQVTFDAMTQFMGILLDPFIGGRGDPATSATGPVSFAEEGDASAYAASGRRRSSSERDAYGLMTKAPLRNVHDSRWSVWGVGFGGSQTTDGSAALGSNTATSRVFGVAAGADYLLSPRTVAGFALAGGGTNFNVANGGSGRSDLFQAGAFIRHNAGATYVAAALAYGWQDVTTDRTVTVAGIDRLRAEFNANAWSGRVEGGYRFVTPWMGLSPYAAGQFTTYQLPVYAEQVLSGANTFALNYAAKDVTASRSELGVRTDKSFAMQNAILTLRGRAAWAHNFNIDRSITPVFQTLPGASFVVNGAAQAHDAALVTGSAEMKWLNGFSLAATFEGEFSDVTTSYAGKGVARYAW